MGENMVNILNMLERVASLNDIREDERKKAAEQLQAEIAKFVEHYGYASTDKCPSTGRTYVLLREGLILLLSEDEEEGESVEIRNLSLPEMEFLREYMKNIINNDIQYQEDEIGRYQDLCR